MTKEDISQDFIKKVGELLYKQIFFFKNKFIQVDITKLNPKECSNTLYSDIYKPYFNLKENSGNFYTHWRLLNTQACIIELANDVDLGTIYYINKNNTYINWFGYILIFDYEN